MCLIATTVSIRVEHRGATGYEFHNLYEKYFMLNIFAIFSMKANKVDLTSKSKQAKKKFGKQQNGNRGIRKN